MGNLSKMVGGIVSAIIAYVVAQFGLPEAFLDPGIADYITGAIVALLGGGIVYAFPKNEKP